MSIYSPSDNEEKELMDEIDRGEWTSVSADKRRELLELSKKAAIESQKKVSRMNIRLTENDMLKLKVKAMERGIPYQTLVTELIHEYVAK
jgi:predicted DNA binding CopG/RHH family protein